jgi:hypothetical protein
MGKIGRPPKDAAEKKGVHRSLRMSTQLRDELDRARRGSTRSFNEEIELRLERSFALDEQVIKRFGSHGTYALFLMMAEGILLIEHNCVRGDEKQELKVGNDHFETTHLQPKVSYWLHNGFIFDQVTSLINVMLSHFRPKGRRVKPKHLDKQFAENIGRQIALYQLQGLQIKNPEVLKTTRADRMTLTNASLLRRFLKGSPAHDLLRSLEKQVPRDLRQSFRKQVSLKDQKGERK